MDKVEKKKKQAEGSIIYVVQSDINRDEVYTFRGRPQLCTDMGTVTGSMWSKDTLDYHFGKLKAFKYSYRGYTIYATRLKKGLKRGTVLKKTE